MGEYIRPVTLRGLTGPLRERNFRQLFIAQATSMLGDNIAPIAIAFAVFDLDGSASDLGIVLAARTVAFLLPLIAGGVWADRLQRRHLMIASDVGRCATQGITAALLFTGRAEIWHLVALQAGNGFALAFFRPAASGLVPQVVSSGRLQQANAVLSLSTSLSSIIGPAVAGAVVAIAGSGSAIALDAATFALSALFLLRLRIPRAARGMEPARFVADLADGWRHVISRKWVWVSIAEYALFQFLILSSLFVLGPLISKDQLGGPAAWALIVSALGVGAVVGDLVALTYRPRRRLLVGNLTLLVMAPCLLMLAFPAPLYAIAASAVAAGIAFSLPDTFWNTTLQENIPEEALSRVSSYDWLGSTALRPIGYAIVGPIADVAGVRTTLTATAALLVVSQVPTVAVRALRELQRKDIDHAGPLQEHE